LKDYYKILNLTFGASETEIKRSFRKLATIYHPDKNGGSKISEEAFKEILNAYEILSNSQSRATYDLIYKQHFQQSKRETTYQNRTNSNKNNEQTYQSTESNSKHQRKVYSQPKVNYSFWIILIFLALLYFFNTNKKTSTGNSKADQQLEEQKSENRPQSGELDFKK